MSMLAGPKKKQQLTLNPRGTLWAKDENKFGQKLLERMGWSKGKGLGKQEQGLHDPLRVSMNDERKGVGFKGNDEGWTKHCDAFEDVLANLSDINSPHGGADIEEEMDDGKVDSLELQSKSLKKRVHYKKFTAGKDLSRYNEDDLASVLGSKRASKKIKKKEEEIQEELKKEEEETGEVGQMDKSHGLTTIYGGSLKDYFSQKMEELQRKREGGLLGEAGPKNVQGSIPDLEFEPSKTNFSFNVSIQDFGEGGGSGGPAESCPTEEGAEGEAKEGKKKKKDKKRKRERQAELEKEAEREILEAELKKKSKKRKKNEKELEQEECDVMEGEREGKENKENESAQLEQDASRNELKKKKKKRKEKDIPEEEEENGSASKENIANESKEAKRNEMNHSYVSATSCDEKKKKKKKRKDREEDQEESKDSKLRKLASEVSLADKKAKVEEEEVAAKQEEAKPNRKLMSKQSFRDFKAELGQKLKKIGKSSDTLSKGALESLFPGSNLATIKGYD